MLGKEYGKIDPAGRFKFPAAYKKQLLSVIEQGFVIRKSIFEECLELYPRAEFENEKNKTIARLNPYNRNDRLMIRKISEGNLVELDSSDRILIPSDQKKIAKIEKDIVMNARGNVIEIWDEKTYAAIIEQPNIDYAAMFEKRLGDTENTSSDTK
jgi:MraZ protein